MKKQKANLNNLKVKSFIIEFPSEASQTVKGGDGPDSTHKPCGPISQIFGGSQCMCL
ncbi:MAG: pinensin family lanthipeptide [Bacteroidota bacterium]